MLLQLKKENYYLVIEPHADPRNIKLGKKVGKFVLSYPIRGYGFLLFQKPEYPGKHMIENNLHLLESIGCKIYTKELKVPVLKELDKRLSGFLKNTSPVCVNPGTGRKEKEWSTEKWIDLINTLPDKQAVLTGSKAERNTNSLIAKKTGAVDMTGKLSLLELAAFLKHCSLFIGPDTGPLHIARAVKTPVIGLFGPTDPNVWGYNKKPYLAVKKASMNQIEVKDVTRVLHNFS